VIVPYGGESAE